MNSGYSYDAAGNLTTDASTGHTFQWDAEGRVSTVDNGSTWAFTYNALGHRVQWQGNRAEPISTCLTPGGLGWGIIIVTVW